MDKPFIEDKDIEEEISGSKYGKKSSIIADDIASNDVVYLEGKSEQLTQISVNDNFPRELFLELISKLNRLEEKISKLEKKQEEYKIQNLLDQNEISRMELENIFELNDSEESSSLEGLLSEFVDKNENSLEMIQSVRDNS